MLPLDLTPFEFYYWCDDHPEYPTSFPIELRFSGSLARWHFEAAIGRALQRHPLLRSLVRIDEGTRPRWVSSSGQQPFLDWDQTGRPMSHPDGAFIDLRRSIGLRIWVRETVSTSRVRFQFHHACCDALGALRFIEDLLLCYDAEFAGRPPSLRPLDADQLAHRGDYGLSDSNYKPNLRDCWNTVRFWLPLLLRPAKRLEPQRHGSTSPGPTDSLDYLTHDFDHEGTSRLNAAASRMCVTVNDLVVRDLLLTLEQWNATNGRSRRHLRINLPVNLRLSSDRRMPAANVLGFWFLSRKASELKSHEQLLESISSEIRSVAKWRLALYFVGGLGVAGSWPRMMQWALRRDHCFATVVCSNVGKVLLRTSLDKSDKKLFCGGVRLEHLSGAPPIRRGTRAAIAVCNYAGRISINLRWDVHFISREEAQRLLATLVDRIGSTIRSDEPATSVH